ncbi:hypothetical protein EZV62_003648 [Acer yangbiense]|uniref:Serine-threonine/tyrosine-protein kinase catalytic domain-containing protein n=1 Tax=Acer yangbiense TaxID=1000413 RepID=A0A5C7IHE8_9ROSI|nr:hypothetical protein EZV62_003648 [Acer yangbiense]
MVAYFFNLQNRENQKTVMEISKHFLFALLSSFVVAVFVHCQDQSESNFYCHSSSNLSCDENPNLRCYEKKKNKFVVPLVASAAAVLFTLLIALAIWLRFKRRKEQDRNASNLSWESRLQIAMDAAQGEDENVHITQWVIDMLGNGDITNIVDPSLEGDFETNSAWKAVELALACASHVSSKRPTMNDVVTELKECLAMETARKKNDRGSEANSVREIFTMNNMDTEFSTPRAR